MSIQLRALAGAAILALSLTACGGGGAEEANPEDSALVETKTQEAEVKTGFDAPVTTADGLTFTLSAPASFKPGDFATGLLDGQLNTSFNIKVENTGTADADLSTVIVSATTATGMCTDIFDGDNNVMGAPVEPVAAGGSFDFVWALSCPGAAGDEISVVLANQGTNVIEVTGKLA
jgi:predicted small lipoprotein YifL